VRLDCLGYRRVIFTRLSNTSSDPMFVSRHSDPHSLSPKMPVAKLNRFRDSATEPYRVVPAAWPAYHPSARETAGLCATDSSFSPTTPHYRVLCPPIAGREVGYSKSSTGDAFGDLRENLAQVLGIRRLEVGRGRRGHSA